MLIVGLIIGLIVGFGVMYWISRNQLDEERERAFEQKEKVRQELEQAHELRLREATQALQADYKREQQQKDAAWEARISALQAEHQQQLAAEIAPSPPLPEVADTAPNLGQFEALLEPIADEEEVEGQPLEPETPPEAPEAIAAPSESAASPEPALESATPESSSLPPWVIIDEPAPIQTPETRVAAPSDEPALVQPPETIAAPSVEERRAETEPATRKRVEEPEPLQAIAQLTSFSQLKQSLYHPSDRVRATVAAAIGRIAAGKPVRAEIEQALPTLGKLSRDSSATVRQAAVESLGNIKSDRVIPLLQQALRDSDRHVVKTASAAIARFKFYPAKTKHPLPANAAKKPGMGQ
jgi:HEAT repeat protein